MSGYMERLFAAEDAVKLVEVDKAYLRVGVVRRIVGSTTAPTRGVESPSATSTVPTCVSSSSVAAETTRMDTISTVPSPP